MKALTTAILLFFVLMAFTVEADAGSFNLSGSFDPGFTIGRGHHNRKSRSHVRGEKGEEDAANDAPKPDEVHNFDVPEVFTQAGEASDNDGNDEQPTRHHGGSHRRSRKH
ncbi:uncharacterized protein LOC126771891 isoform X1 [Nymphalis io]|uniref:uncharacterized protein LOC126771891 isoform X1 n=1 Tax=Inachis io TaxID=171585 RepID=UPI00216835C6|nr:uncharacterized protein LOC126771891 isoform X1 [Nymphalis io]